MRLIVFPAIALSLLAEGLADRVVALDVSADAIAQASENAVSAGQTGAIDLRLCDETVWDGISPAERFDLIVSNPPYIPTGEIDGLDVHVRDHEPRAALDGGVDGLDVVRTILKGAPLSVRASKQAVMRGLDEPDLASALANQARYPAFGTWFNSADAAEGPRAFAEKRAPEWQGR